MCLLPQLPRRRRLLLLLYWSGVEGGNRVNGLILVLLMKPVSYTHLTLPTTPYV